MINYTPLHVHSHYSLLLGLSKPSDIAERCDELQIDTCAITDEASIAGAVAFYKEMVSHNIKPIIGCKLIIKTESNLSRLTVLCKNKNGWKNLIRIISESNSVESYNGCPTITLSAIKNISNNLDLICITGYHNSSLWNMIVSDNELNNNWQEILSEHIANLRTIFGNNNVFIELCLLHDFYNQKNINQEIRQYCQQNNIDISAGIHSLYCKKEDSVDQRILVCSKLKTTLPEISKKIISNIDTGYNHIFTSDSYDMPSFDDIKHIYTDKELSCTNYIASLCESFNPLSKPVLPKFQCPKDYTSDSEYLRQLCRNGWKKKISNSIPKESQDIYIDRIKYELEVLEGANLSSYFLIVSDILQFIRDSGWLPGPGRGSAAGCLVSYLIGITNIDPIKYNLLFERFYNAGRNTSDRISMPDIDVDVPINARDLVINYIKSKYGIDRVAQMITFNTLKGRGALKEVLRVHGNISFEEMNNITKNIPDEAKIADELQEIKEEEGSASIIQWALENNPEKFKEWCHIEENGQLSGPLAKRFEQAIRIEGTKYNQSKHAAGVAIAAEPLNQICPMIFDTKTEQNIAGLEMNDLDALGVIKFDILGIALLDKVMFVNHLIKESTCNSQN